eukprot:SAG11_NODE_7140_length_1188_cov_1.104683_1_plen_335_part_10
MWRAFRHLQVWALLQCQESVATVSEDLSGRVLSAAPIYRELYREHPYELAEIQLRSVFQALGGLDWSQHHGWDFEREHALPPPPPDFNETIDMMLTTQAVVGHCDNGTRLQLVAPNTTSRREWWGNSRTWYHTAYVETVSESVALAVNITLTDENLDSQYPGFVLIRWPMWTPIPIDNTTESMIFMDTDPTPLSQNHESGGHAASEVRSNQSYLGTWDSNGTTKLMNSWGAAHAAVYHNITAYHFNNTLGADISTRKAIPLYDTISLETFETGAIVVGEAATDIISGHDLVDIYNLTAENWENSSNLTKRFLGLKYAIATELSDVERWCWSAPDL